MKQLYILTLTIFLTTITAFSQTDVVTGLNSPWGLLLNGNDLYIGEFNSKIDITATLPTTATDVTTTGLLGVGGFSLNGDDLYFSQSNANKISKIDITATLPAR